MKAQSYERPAAIQPLGNGAYYYNYAITETTTAAPDGTTRPGYEYKCVKIWGTPDAAAVIKAVIRDEVDETAEFDLVNSYNAAQEGMLDEAEAAEAVEAYKTYLRRVQEIKITAKADLIAAGYDR